MISIQFLSLWQSTKILDHEMSVVLGSHFYRKKELRFSQPFTRSMALAITNSHMLKSVFGISEMKILLLSLLNPFKHWAKQALMIAECKFWQIPLCIWPLHPQNRFGTHRCKQGTKKKPTQTTLSSNLHIFFFFSFLVNKKRKWLTSGFRILMACNQ